MRSGRGPRKIPAHGRQISGFIELAAPRMRGVGGRRGSAPDGCSTLPTSPPCAHRRVGGSSVTGFPSCPPSRSSALEGSGYPHPLAKFCPGILLLF